jgi:diketogulonate reductase-like aldo/keto reductase
MGRQWKLGIGVHEQDDLLSGFTFESLITALHCGEKVIDVDAVYKTVDRMVEIAMQDMNFLLRSNIVEIIRRAMKGRE